MTSPDARAEAGLVPLRDRIWYLQAVRALLVIAIVGYAISTPTTMSLARTIAWSLGYLALTTPTLALTRARRSNVVPVFAGSLLLDGVYLAVMTYGSNHFNSPLQYIVAAHVIATTLLGSFRTGLKITFWHSLLICVTYQFLVSTSSTQLTDDAKSSAIALIAVLWTVTIATATFGSVNERELRQRNLDLQDLARLSLALEGADRPEAVGETLVGFAVEVLRINRAIFIAIDDEAYRCQAFRGVSIATATDGDPSRDLTLRRALESRRTLQLTHLLPDDDSWLTSVMPNARNVLIFPMHVEARPVGVLVAEYGLRRSARVERRVVAIVERFVSHTALALVNASLLAQIRAQAATDGLTGVANRRSFDLAIEQAVAHTRRDGSPLSLILGDLDHFKLLNDKYGHQAGDDALRGVAAIIGANIRASDCVARYGGEEFAILLPATSPALAATTAERLRSAVEIAQLQTPVTASFGVATTSGAAAHVDSLIRRADLALYEAKRRGRNQIATADDSGELTA